MTLIRTILLYGRNDGTIIFVPIKSAEDLKSLQNPVKRPAKFDGANRETAAKNLEMIKNLSKKWWCSFLCHLNRKQASMEKTKFYGWKYLQKTITKMKTSCSFMLREKIFYVYDGKFLSEEQKIWKQILGFRKISRKFFTSLSSAFIGALYCSNRKYSKEKKGATILCLCLLKMCV